MKKELKEEIKEEKVESLDDLTDEKETVEPVKKTRGRKPKVEKEEVVKAVVIEETKTEEKPVEVVETKEIVEVAKPEEPKKEEAPIHQDRKKIVFGDDFGVKSDDVLEDEKKEKEDKAKFFERLKKYKDEEKVLWGYVSGAESDGNMAGAVVIWNDMRIIIPDSAFFMPNTVFPKGYKDSDKKGKITARKQFISYQINARICFVITDVAKTKDGVVMMGSRVKAMRKLQDRYFYHLKDKTLEETGIKLGDIAYAHVLYVRAYNVLVECLGVETYLDAFNLSNEAVDNCFEFVKPGDTVKVRLKKIHLNENTNEGVYLTVSGRLNATPEQIKNIKKGATYSGTIKGYNKANACYTVRLKDGVNVSVLKKNVNKKLNLVRNDNVIVLVTSVKDDYVMGSIVTQI